MLLAKQMPVAAISQLVDEEDTRLWRLIARVVKEAHAAADWSEVCSWPSTRPVPTGRWYVTVFLDAETTVYSMSPKAVVVTPSKSSLRPWLLTAGMAMHSWGRHGHVALLRRRGTRTLSHVAVDEVRRALQRQGADLKEALWTLRGNPWKEPRRGLLPGGSLLAPSSSGSAILAETDRRVMV